MALPFKFLDHNFKIMLWPAFFWALSLSIVTIIFFYGIFIAGIFSETENAFPIIIGIILSELLSNVLYAFVLYLGLKNISMKLSMDTYWSRLTFCIYLTANLIIINSILLSLINQEFTFPTTGLIPAIIMFTIPALYKPKSEYH